MNLFKQLYKKTIEQRWTIGFVETPLRDIIDGKPLDIHYLRDMPSDRWFADPFILDVAPDTVQLLVEEFSYSLRKGRIARLTVDRSSYRLRDFKIILELESHLSFPAILRENDRIFIYPENSAANELSIYEYVLDTCSCKKIETIIEAPLTDAIITSIFGNRLIFSTHLPSQNGNTLSVYRYDTAADEPVAEHTFDSDIARNAGDWFLLDGNAYRPAQDCDGAYGRAVILQEVSSNNGHIQFSNIRRLTSGHPHYTTGLHTFNHYQGVTAIDVHGYRHQCTGKAVASLRNILKRR